MRLVLILSLVSASAWAQPSPETQLTMTSLRPGEKDRLLKALGPAEEIPLYRAQLDVDPDKRTVTGKVYVTFPVKKKALSSLLLRVPPNAEGKRITLRNAMAGGAPTTLEQPEPTLFKVKLDPAVPVGGAVELELRLDAIVPAASKDSDNLNSSMGGGEGDYGAFSAAPEVISLAGLMPVVPPTGADGLPWPGPSGIGDLAEFDPSDFLVSVTVPSAYRVVAPGNQLGEVPQQGGKTQYAYGISGARDFTLFVTRGYEMSSLKVNDVTVEAFYLPGDAASGKKVLKYAADALGEYERHLTPYPWTTFRVVEARLTGGAGGMEFPGLVSVSTALYRGATDPLAALGMPGLGAAGNGLGDLVGDLKPLLEKTLEFTIAHEVAHQWFAIMVGNDPVREPVVDEPLTQHAALLYMEWKHGKKSADVMRDAQLKMAYQVMRMMGGEDAIADRPTNEFESTNQYAAVIYGKAPMLFDALRAQTGDSTYFKALKSYAETYRWKNASDVGFTTELAKAGGSAKTIEKLRRHWWLESHGDEDIGVGDLGSLVGGMLGGQSGQQVQQLDAQTQKMLEEALKALGGM